MNSEPELYMTYWISTTGKKRLCWNIPSNERPAEPFYSMYSMKPCNRFTYWLFKKTKINLIAKDKFAWLNH
jgi:hypothetical protein